MSNAPESTIQSVDPSWLQTYLFAFGQPPDNYLVIDAEASGVETDEDVAIQLGQVVVRNRMLVHSGGSYLNWFNTELVNHQWLLNRIQTTTDVMASKGARFHVTPELMRTQGKDPVGVIVSWGDMIEQAVNNNITIAGHNIVSFDLPMLCKASYKITGKTLLIPDNLIWDTGMFEKARLVGIMPWKGERRIDYFFRVHAHRSYTKWGLSTGCAERYNLWVKSGLNPFTAHDAVADCILTHHLLESHRLFFGK